MTFSNAKFNKLTTGLFTAILFGLLFCNGPLHGQQTPTRYKFVERTIYEKTPVKVDHIVRETVNETQKVTRYKTVWETEKRERRETYQKPVIIKSERDEEVLVRREVKETRQRERRIEETVMEKVTEMRDQEVIVESKVYETELRDEKVVVKRPVTERILSESKRTAYRPQIVTDSELAVGNLQVNQLVPGYNGRPRPRWLSPGYYLDPATGQTVYKSRGFHWVPGAPTLQLQTQNIPVLTTQNVDRVVMVPETVVEQKPVEVTRMVDTVETRKVPHDVERIQRRTEVRKVPVVVERPKTIIRTEQVPYDVTTFKDEIVTRKVPVEKTIYETAERIVPYEVRVAKKIPIEEEVQVPRVIEKVVKVDMIKHTPRKVMFRVPIDEYGNELGPGEPMVFNRSYTARDFQTPATSTPPDVEIRDRSKTEETSGQQSILENSTDSDDPETAGPVKEYHAVPRLRNSDAESKETAATTPKEPAEPVTDMVNVIPNGPRPQREIDESSLEGVELDFPRAQPPERSPKDLDEADEVGNSPDEDEEDNSSTEVET